MDQASRSRFKARVIACVVLPLFLSLAGCFSSARSAFESFDSAYERELSIETGADGKPVARYAIKSRSRPSGNDPKNVIAPAQRSDLAKLVQEILQAQAHPLSAGKEVVK